MTESNDTRRSTTPMIIVIACVAFAFAMLFVLMRYAGSDDVNQASDQTPGVGKPLGELRLEPLVGRGQPFGSSDIQNKVVLINFWGTWCGPCHMELPHLIELNDRWRDNPDFLFLSVSCAYSVEEETIGQLRKETESFLKERQFNLVVHWDPRGVTRHALVETAGWQNEGFVYPMTVLVDRTGVIRNIWRGYAPGIENEMDAAVKTGVGAK